ncbi:MAG: hypothetical protein AAF141_12090, partial [Pseudomonadota bacterium]
WPDSETLDSWALGHAMNRGADVCLPHQRIGEDALRTSSSGLGRATPSCCSRQTAHSYSLWVMPEAA